MLMLQQSKLLCLKRHPGRSNQLSHPTPPLPMRVSITDGKAEETPRRPHHRYERPNRPNESDGTT